MPDELTLGVEEEYQIVDAKTRALRARERQILAGAESALGERVQPELHASQIEIATPVCQTLDEVRAQLVDSRRTLIESAAQNGCRIGAAGTHPFSDSTQQPITPKERYQSMTDEYQHLARELVIFGCHVHVGLADPEAGVRVLSRARAWLAPLLALSANSPFWNGADTGYASFRTEMWTRWPMSGPPPAFGSRAEHDGLIEDLVQTGSISDATKIYWDIRLPQRVPTVEFRVADVCLTVDEAVMLAGLSRGLVRTFANMDDNSAPVRGPLLRAAHWRAARYGLEGELIDFEARRSSPAPDVIHSLLNRVRPALEEQGDWDTVSTLVAETLTRGNGAQRQRAAWAKSGRWEDVADLITEETQRGIM